MKSAQFILVIVMISCLVIGCTSQIKPVSRPVVWEHNQQMVMVLSKDWNSKQGIMFLSEYRRGGWKTFPKKFIVSLGARGLAWDPYFHGKSINKMPIKREGDYRSPAGLFYLGESFGYEKYRCISYPYRAMDKNEYCIDDPKSEYYNKIVDVTRIERGHLIKSGEPMRRDLNVNGDKQYETGIVIRYNIYNYPYEGSCIFIHVKRNNKNFPTAGCTAMSEQDLDTLLRWLRAYHHPIIVVLPISEYNSRKKDWDLPVVNVDAVKD